MISSQNQVEESPRPQGIMCTDLMEIVWLRRFRDVAAEKLCVPPSQEELGGQLVWQRPPAAWHHLPTIVGQLAVCHTH